MDPLSISTSVAGLVTLAGTVFSLVAKYIKNVNEAPKEAKDLLDEVKQFSILLHHLSLVARELEITTKDGEEALRDSPNLQWHHIYDCQTILNRVDQGLRRATEDLQSPSTFKKIRSRLKWPFSSDDTKHMIQTIERHKQTIDVALSANSYSRLALCLSRQETAGKRLESIQDTVKKIIEIDTKVFMDETRRKVLDFFIKFANPWHEFEMVQNLRHPSTGLWFTESADFKDWRVTPGSKLWVTGIPGAGKSVLAGLIIHECLKFSSADDRKATTYFFCTYRNKATHSARNLLSSLASQLARQNEEAFQVLENYYQDLVSQKPLAAEPSLQKLLTVFETMCRMFDEVFVVVDGLDECESDEVIHNLSKLVLKKNGATVTTLLLSRDVVHIRDRLESDFSHTEIEAHTEDIQLYVYAELEMRIESKRLRLRNPELKAEIVDRLVHGSKGMFRWVACQLDYLGELASDRERRNALSKLPPTLPATYERILMQVEKSSKEARRLVQNTLLLLRAGLCEVHLLQEALSIRDDSKTLTEEDKVDEYEIMLRCSSLVRKSGGDRIEFSHFTVQEFLEGIDPTHATLYLYRVSHYRAQNLMAQVCLRYLMLKEFEKEPQPDEEFQHSRKRANKRPFYRFSTSRWVDCIRELVDENSDEHVTEIDTTTMELMQTLFESRKATTFCQWVIEYTILSSDCSLGRFTYLNNVSADYKKPWGSKFYSMGIRGVVPSIAAIIRPDFTPFHMASLLGLSSLCDHLLRYGAKVNLNSRFGTPLHCALAGFPILLGMEALDNCTVATSRAPILWGPIAQSQTVRVLLAAGASATPRLSTPFQQTTLMGTMHLSPIGFKTFALFPDLLQAGLVVEEEDLIPMETRLERMDEDETKLQVVGTLLRCLKSTSDNNGSPLRRLHSILYQFALSKQLDLGDLAFEKIPDELVHTDNGNRPRTLESMIKSNNVIALEEAMGEHLHDLLMHARFNVDGEEWTAVHLACASSSSDVLELLLGIGIDPEITTHRGTKPIHLIEARQDGGETLRVLLQHHVSTTAKSGSLGTVWHLRIQNNDIQALKLLVSLSSDKNEALQIVSDLGQTAICLALDKQNEYAVTLLLEHCASASFWESNIPLYRQAARLGSLQVVKKLLDMGIELDDFDDELGSPLHDLNPRASVLCIKVLVEAFPHCYRQRKDGQIPFQLFLTRAIKEGIEIEPQVLEALLPSFGVCQPEKIAKEYKISALVLFATEFDRTLSMLLPEWLDMRQGIVLSDYPRKLPRLSNWKCLSQMLVELASKTAFGDSVANNPNIIRLLSHAILHDDHDLVRLLLQNNVDVHRRVDPMSALEIACLPAVTISEDTFRCVLSYAKADRLNEHNECVRGLTITHFAGARAPSPNASAWKLRLILEVGANANAVSSDFLHEPAILFHISAHNFSTAGVLLQFGADPWLTNVNGFNAALLATWRDNTSFLKTISRYSTSRKLEAKWNQTWRDPSAGFSGGNAFHLAAWRGHLDCMRTYLDEKWLDELDSVGAFYFSFNSHDKLQTPMHYAALFGNCFIIRFLHDHGCNVDRTTQRGKTPLHLAIDGEHLGAVKELLQLGAKMKVDTYGLSPLDYAYRKGNLMLINAVQNGAKGDESMTFELGSKVITEMADAFYVALSRGDLDVCNTFIAQGFPIDSEMCEPWPVTPLMLALSEGMSSEVVEWLLTQGAKASIVFEGPNMPEYSTALEAAIADEDYNHLLLLLLHRCLEEDGDFSCMKGMPLHVAASEENYDGLRVLLDELLRKSYNVRDIVNQKDHLGGTALHEAAKADSVDASTLLISNGANLEALDSYGYTPLHDAADNGSINVLKLLIKQGACTEPLTSAFRSTPLMLACSEGHAEEALYLLQFGQNVTEDSFGTDIMTMALEGEDESFQVKLASMLFPEGFDIHRPDDGGMCAILRAMARPRHWVLRYILRHYPLSLRIRDIQWSSPYVRLAITSRYLSLANIAKGGLVAAVSDLLSIGIDIETAVCGEGTVLTVAAAHGQLGVVKYLVRRGAKLSHVFDCLQEAPMATDGRKEVLQWLLVGQYTDQAKIMGSSQEEDKQVIKWMGTMQIKVSLKWEWKQRRAETMLDYVPLQYNAIDVLTSVRAALVWNSLTVHLPPYSSAAASSSSVPSATSGWQSDRRSITRPKPKVWDTEALKRTKTTIRLEDGTLVEIQKGLLQVSKALEFLHENAGLVHGNLTPESVLINAKSDWKISGLAFCSPPENSSKPTSVQPISLSEALNLDARLPRYVQINLDYTSPDFVLDNNLTTSPTCSRSDCCALLYIIRLTVLP
ncbi:hypothetical protein NUW58_g6229 [Xylaria curta]|uniref:Uncharacterized protein n=1 Tax=Xylaria curta TaxID=42375 RepID=A0ACC1NW47_9PEZI|nr:hypothetical protein NUW58_g6229 [Xylaria curta]